jgi:hypothetical protein
MKKSSLWKTPGTAGCLTLVALIACLYPATAEISASGKEAQGKAAASAPQYTVLNPEAQLPEVDTKALSPRLSSFAGKTIVIFDNRGGYEKPMRGLADQLKPLLPPDTKFVYYTPTTTTWTAADQAKIPLGDAAIVGHAY